MAREALRNIKGQIIGWLEVSSNGDKMLRNYQGQILGYYDSRENVTRNYNRQKVAKGDLLTSLLQIR